MLLNTLKLKLSLRIAGFDVRTHPYDWRRSVGDLASELNERIELDDDPASVMLVGHSMGGLVARVALGASVSTGSPGSCNWARRITARSRRCSRCAACTRRCGSWPRSIVGIRAEDLARIVFEPCRRCTSCCRSRRLAGGLDLFDAAAWPDDELRPAPALLAAAAQRAGAVAGNRRALPAHYRCASGDRDVAAVVGQCIRLRHFGTRRRHRPAVARRPARRTEPGTSARSMAACPTTAV